MSYTKLSGKQMATAMAHSRVLVEQKLGYIKGRNFRPEYYQPISL